ncbi:hypothetical protein LOS05_03940, partial [Proteus mirabilis]|nr:hypothetical protein [Proteus mirabilis]
FEWVHVQLHQQKGMISLSPPTICNSAAGNVWLPHKDIAPWITETVDEITTFPFAGHDDTVDAMTQALRYLFQKKGGGFFSRKRT